MKIWKPNPGPQEEVLRRSAEFEILYGGARGGGKTDAGQVWLTDYVDDPRYRALVIRKNADDLSDWVDRATRMYSGLKVSMAYRPPILTFPSGAVIRTGHLKDEQAYTKYQGHEYHRMLIEELTQISSEKRYLQLISSCRSTVPELKPQVFLTTNPGGIGHSWVKQRFVDPAPPGVPFTDPETGRKRIFIPADIEDNPFLMENDPSYVGFLDGLKSVDEQLYKAWRLGSWDVFVGQVFNEWRYNMHVVSQMDFPLSVCKKIIGFDWGYNAPGCASWLAITPENKYGVKRIYHYRELYQRERTPEQWANDMNVFLQHEKVEYIVLPHDCFAHKDGNQSIADVFRIILKCPIKEGHTLERGARRNRLALTHQHLAPAKDGKPYLLTLDRCTNFIRTLPELVYDETNIEDLNSEGDDHSYDALSLALLSLYVGAKGGAPVKVQPRSATNPTFATNEKGEMLTPDFWEAMRRKQRLGGRESWEYK